MHKKSVNAKGMLSLRYMHLTCHSQTPLVSLLPAVLYRLLLSSHTQANRLFQWWHTNRHNLWPSIWALGQEAKGSDLLQSDAEVGAGAIRHKVCFILTKISLWYSCSCANGHSIHPPFTPIGGSTSTPLRVQDSLRWCKTLPGRTDGFSWWLLANCCCLFG